MKNYSFGNYICELREKKGYSQKQLGEMLGVTNKAVSRWENGSAYPSTELMLPLAKTLDVTIDDLYRMISVDNNYTHDDRIYPWNLIKKYKLIRSVCIVLAIFPCILFLIFSKSEDKAIYLLFTVAISILTFVLVYYPLVFLVKKQFLYSRMFEIYSLIIYSCVIFRYCYMLLDYVFSNFPDGYSPVFGFAPSVFFALTCFLKKYY